VRYCKLKSFYEDKNYRSTSIRLTLRLIMARTLSSLDAALCADYVRPQRLKRRFNRGEFSSFENRLRLFQAVDC
jgi:hypothetical protein